MSQSPSITSQASPQPPVGAQRAKRRRLNLACNYCRSRKTRCDEQKPSCHACLAAGLSCITTDPRKPDQHVERHQAGQDRHGRRNTSTSVFASPGNLGIGTPNASQISHERVEPAVVQRDEIDTDSTPNRRGAEEPDRESGSSDRDGTSEGRRYRGPLLLMKHHTSSSTVGILTDWLNLAFFRLGLRSRFTYRSPTEEDRLQMPMIIQLPQLPNIADCRAMLDSYFRTINAVYPVLDEAATHRILDTVQFEGAETFITEPRKLPFLVSLLLALQLGSTAHSSKKFSIDFGPFCNSLIGWLVGQSTPSTVQATFLLALSHYYRDNLASAWPMMSLCVSIATATGLNMNNSSASTRPAEERESNRIWWTVFCFEKLLAFELGRKSLIGDSQPYPKPTFVSFSEVPNESAKSSSAFRLFTAVISLAKSLDTIGHRCVEQRDREELSDKNEMERAIAEKVRTIGEACLTLTRWAESLPDHLRPGSDLIFDQETFPGVAALSMHYYNALLVLTRNSLLITESALHKSIEMVSNDAPWRGLLQRGPSIAANTARKLIKLFIEAEEVGTRLAVCSAGTSLHALYVLAVYVIKQPKSRMAEADMNLINHAADFTMQHSAFATAPNLSAEEPRSRHTASDLDRIITSLRNVVKEAVQSPLRRITPDLPAARPSWPNTAGTIDQNLDLHTLNNPVLPQNNSIDIPMHDWGSLDVQRHGAAPMPDNEFAFDLHNYYDQGMDMGMWLDLGVSDSRGLVWPLISE